MTERTTQIAIDVDAARDELQNLKNDINSSFEEVANMFLELQSGLALINDRIELYNRKSSHKL